MICVCVCLYDGCYRVYVSLLMIDNSFDFLLFHSLLLPQRLLMKMMMLFDNADTDIAIAIAGDIDIDIVADADDSCLFFLRIGDRCGTGRDGT